MHKDVTHIIREYEEFVNKGKLTDAIDLLSDAIMEFEGNIELILFRAEVYVLDQKFGAAINDYRKYLDQNPKDLTSKSRLNYLETLLETGRNDIYASTNLNLDPWLD